MLDDLTQRYLALVSVLDERSLRLWAGAEARILGHGGIKHVARMTGLSHSTVQRGLHELSDEISRSTDLQEAHDVPLRVRKPGGGRHPTVQHDPTLLRDLEELIAPSTRGDPELPLRWTTKSLRHLAKELTAMGHAVSHELVGRMLRHLGYSLQAPRKVQEGSSHPDRNAQFCYIDAQTKQFQECGEPVISVDCKKKELIGHFGRAGQEWQPVGQPERVLDHSFPSQAKGKGIPYGVYDVTKNNGWVSVGIDHDTAAFSVHTIRTWWHQMGRVTYPKASRLMITADCGGSNGVHSHLWKMELQRFADETELDLHICHYPPGTSKWNKIEHRLFSQITLNWRGRPLESYDVIVNLIANTTTEKGLKVKAGLDKAPYPTGNKVSPQVRASLNIESQLTHPAWNYVIHPRSAAPKR